MAIRLGDRVTLVSSEGQPMFMGTVRNVREPNDVIVFWDNDDMPGDDRKGGRWQATTGKCKTSGYAYAHTIRAYKCRDEVQCKQFQTEELNSGLREQERCLQLKRDLIAQILSFPPEAWEKCSDLRLCEMLEALKGPRTL